MSQLAVDRRTRWNFALFVGLIALVAGGKAVLFDTLDPDSFLHMLAARQMKSDGIGPIVDHQSFASVQTAWTPYSWLAEFGMLEIWNLGGYRAAIMVQAAMAAYLMVLVSLSCRSLKLSGTHPLAPPVAVDADDNVPRATRLQSIAATAFAGFLSLPYLSFRPVTLAIALLAFCVLLLIRDRSAGEHSKAIWWLIPLTALITNVHLVSIFVPMWVFTLLAGAVWERWQVAMPPDWSEAERRVRRYALLLFGTCIACLATPMLPGFAGAIVHYQFADAVVSGPLVAEFQPFYVGTFGKIGLALVVIFIAGVFIHRRHLRVGDLLWLLVSVGLLFRMGRFAPMFAVVAAPYFAAMMPKLSDRMLGRPSLVAMAALTLAIGLQRVGASFPEHDEPLDKWVNRHGPDTPGYPCDAASYVDRNVKSANGRIINEYTWGGYLEWRLGARYQALLDGRTNLYTSDFWKTTYFGDAKERRDFLATISADAAIVPLEKSVFRDALRELGWRSAFKDDRAEVLLPPEKEFADIQEEPAGWAGVLFN